MNSKITQSDHAMRLIKGGAVAIASFGVLGTVSALWDNPFFIRMTPTGTWEIVMLAVIAVLLGVYTAIRRPFCSVKTAGAGGVLGFLGVACPVCNKILLLLFGGRIAIDLLRAESRLFGRSRCTYRARGRSLGIDDAVSSLVCPFSKTSCVNFTRNARWH